MMNLSTDQITVFVFAMIAVAGAMYAFVYPYLSGEARAEKRKAVFIRGVPDAARKTTVERSIDQAGRRKQVADSLKEIENKTAKKKPSLEARISQAGLVTTTKRKYMVVSAITGIIFAFLVLFISGEIYYFIPALLIGGVGIPSWALTFLKNRRSKKFVKEFPGAIDVIIRGVKAGLPLGDCIRIVASESEEPVKTEFRMIIEATTVGLSIGEAVERMAERVPISETNFFSIVITIQQKAGGNLSEALSNLSRVLRDRKKMEMKVKAMSSEAKASAGIIGALPFIVTGLVYLSSPRYIELLWITSTGRFIMMVAGVWMSLGVMSMKKMVSFDI